MASFLHIAAGLATTVVAAVPVKLKAVVINTKGATANTLTLYDNASSAAGTVIAIIDTTSNVGDIQFVNANTTKGLTVVSATGTGADLTIVWE